MWILVAVVASRFRPLEMFDGTLDGWICMEKERKVLR